MTVEPKQILSDYIIVKPLYERLACMVADRFRLLTQEHGLRTIVEARAKDERSLVKKCILYDGPVEKVPDKAGVKLVVRYQADAQAIDSLILSNIDTFTVLERDIKIDNYSPEHLGYLGIHYQLAYSHKDCPSEIAGLECEVILHTGAESLWDSISHELIYKSFIDLPVPSKRALNRLLALVELFDSEVSNVREEYTSNPEYQEARMLDILEKYYYRFDPGTYSKELSYKTLTALKPVVQEAHHVEDFDQFIRSFVDTSASALNRVFQRYQDKQDIRAIFVHQPETLLIFALFDSNYQDAIKDAWVEVYPRSILEELGATWGKSIPH